MYLITVLYFTIAYFSVAGLAVLLLKRLLVAKSANKISAKGASQTQVRLEIKRSFISILVFGFFGVVPQQAYLHHWVDINWAISPYILPLELLAIFVWNDVHFYICHRLLHVKWLFKHVHYTHHEAHVPTPWSAYSFHWFEATLLSTVMISAMLIHSFCYVSLLFLPMISLILNVLGHWDYDLYPQKSHDFLFRFSYRHSLHHRRVKGNYGFFLPFLDNIFNTTLSSNK